MGVYARLARCEIWVLLSTDFFLQLCTIVVDKLTTVYVKFLQDSAKNCQYRFFTPCPTLSIYPMPLAKQCILNLWLLYNTDKNQREVTVFWKTYCHTVHTNTSMLYQRPREETLYGLSTDSQWSCWSSGWDGVAKTQKKSFVKGHQYKWLHRLTCAAWSCSELVLWEM